MPAPGQLLRCSPSYPCGRHRPAHSRQGPALSSGLSYIEQRPGAVRSLGRTDQEYRRADRIFLRTAPERRHNPHLGQSRCPDCPAFRHCRSLGPPQYSEPPICLIRPAGNGRGPAAPGSASKAHNSDPCPCPRPFSEHTGRPASQFWHSAQ